MRILLATVLTACILIQGICNDSWREVLKSKKGKIVFYWYPNNINVENSKDIIDGVEYDLAVAFTNYLNKKYNLNLEVEWNQTESFDEVMETVSSARGGVFGASSISITKERATYLNFTPPYLTDIAVMVSSPNVPIAQTPAELSDILNGLTAVSIPNTTLLQSLLDLQKELNINFDIQNVSNSGDVIETIGRLDNGFGYIDLPNFLITLKGSPKVRRQFFRPIKLEGLAMVYPKKSDWVVPVNDYFNSDQFESDKHEIIVKYFGEDVTSVIDRISTSADIGPFEEIMISNREKEQQYKELIASTNREKENARFTNFLIAILGFGAFGIAFLFITNRVKSKVNKVLMNQQEVIAKRNQQLRVLNDEKNDLIRVLAHDLRSPLSSIQGSASLLKDDEELKGDSETLVDFIGQASDRMQDMIAKILDADAVESGLKKLNKEAIETCQLVEEVIQANQPIAEKKFIEIECNEKEMAYITADRFYLTQVVENLLSNAIKYSPKHSKINVSVSKEDDQVIIAVSDNGPGFSKEDQEKIFKKYQQLSAKPTDGESSVGLGLSIVKSYTELMGGSISFETSQGKGTTFYVKFTSN